jgi:hypothetical protein
MKRPEALAKYQIESLFPLVAREGYSLTSEHDDVYNCIAFAAGDVHNWWWPDVAGESYWPIPTRLKTLTCFIDAFRTLGFKPCDDANVEPGYQKIAIYTNRDGVPSHASRQLPSGAWASKLGELEDIEHATLAALEGDVYGRVALIMRRPV